MFAPRAGHDDREHPGRGHRSGRPAGPRRRRHRRRGGRATTRVAFTDAAGLAELRALNPSARYVVTVELAGFRTSRQAGVLVRAGQTASLAMGLAVGNVNETVVVTAAPAVVDVTSAVVAEDITLDLTEAVPTGRSYQSYLQLVPGVLPDDPESPGNPASKSGLNYRDIGGDAGVSRDNFYYIDGINVTDGVSGTFGANLNTEIIQEQQVLTGGIPAEYVGAPGLLSSVVTKSGTNQLTGSVNYFFQNDGLVAENRNASDQEFSRFDTALTGGGPIAADEAWFFGSYRRVARNDTVVALDGVDVIRTVEQTQDQFYARGTWAPGTNDTLAFTFLNDPTDVSGSRDRDVTNARDRSRVQGEQLPPAVQPPVRGPARRGLVQPAQRRAVRLRGGARPEQQHRVPGHRRPHPRRRAARRLRARRLRPARHRGLQGTVVAQLGRHAIHGGLELMRNTNLRDTVFDGGQYTSLAGPLTGLTAGELIAGSFTDSRSTRPTAATTTASSAPSTGFRIGPRSTPSTT